MSRRAARKPLLSKKNIRDRLISCNRSRDWTAGVKSFPLINPLSDNLGHPDKRMEKNGPVMSPVKHPETVHV